ncbi:P protein-like [Pectinophora gossypiella]|uniref:P protein-like n=1 Tax=Pectinophora gossypiella TaxID=13191 RepID=UPI00214F14EA|nr:P protein-like [Pectinophora gossypiella]
MTKGMGVTTTTTTPPPPIVIKNYDGIKYGLILVGLILALLFLQTNRVLALFVMAMACASVLSFLQIRPGPDIIVVWLNLDYIFELIFVMMLVAVTADTGFYNLVSFTIYKVCLGSIFGITFMMCVCAFTLSVFMDSVAAILFLTPVAIRTVEQGQMNPTPVLLSMILFCNMASVLDADYNYVNYNIIKGYDKWQATETAFEDTKFHQKVMPGVIASAAATTVYLILVFRLLKPHIYSLPEVAMLIHRQTLLRITASGINRNSKNWDPIRAQLIEWNHEIDQERLHRLTDIHPPRVRERFNKITDVILLMKVILVVVGFFVMLTLRRYNVNGLGLVSIGMFVVACTGYLLIFLKMEDFNSLLRRLQWCTIIGLISIFFIERSLETMRLNKRIFLFLSGLLPEDKSAVPFTVMRYLQWGSFAMSAIFNNFGSVTTMRLVARRFGDMLPDRVADLVYAVTFGCNVGGSATVLGTGVSIACIASAWQQGYRVSACKYMIFMLPITLINMLCVYFIWAILGS